MCVYFTCRPKILNIIHYISRLQEPLSPPAPHHARSGRRIVRAHRAVRLARDDLGLPDRSAALQVQELGAVADREAEAPFCSTRQNMQV